MSYGAYAHGNIRLFAGLFNQTNGGEQPLKTKEEDLIDGKRLIFWLRSEGADASPEEIINEIKRSRFHPFGIYIRHDPGPSTLKKGDMVVMHSCMEAGIPNYEGKVWTCRTDAFKSKSNGWMVMLDGLSGSFSAEFLQRVRLGENGS